MTDSISLNPHSTEHVGGSIEHVGGSTEHVGGSIEHVGDSIEHVGGSIKRPKHVARLVRKNCLLIMLHLAE
jgi:hypothetical protein